MSESGSKLPPGTKLGPYEIEEPLGAGGMGEVYRARDTRLGRTVAIKVLPEHVTADVQARARFEREARIASSLSHPNICTLYDVGHHEGTEFLVMEYLEGETLGDRLKRGTPTIEEALRVGARIAGALESAHRRGLVHRDLKPDNVMLTGDGVKLLDFGLAKAVDDAAAGPSLTASPTATSPLTQQGAVLGTVGYMSPEQLEGREADSRTDIFALGAVLYEMVTGQRAFSGATQASVVAAILKDDPPPMTALRPVTPPALERLVRTCLAKDPERRWQSAGDLERELQWILEEGTSDSGTFTATPPAPTTRKRRTLLLAAVAGWSIAALALVAYFLGPLCPSDRPPPPLIRAEVPAPAHVTEWDFAFGGPMRISPDGRYLVFAVQEHAGSGLWVHDLRKDERRRLEATAGASYPFWSPDSRFIGFFAAHKLRKIPVEGGVIQPLCDAPDGRGAAWSRRGVILFAPNVWGPLYTVPAEGGTAEPLTSAPDDSSHRFPDFLPDGRRFIFLQSRIVDLDCDVMTASLDDPRATLLRSNLTSARFAAGHLLFEEEGTLFAQPLDSGRTALVGGPTPLVEDVMWYGGMGISNFAVSDNDILAYRTAYARERTLEWLDVEGRDVGRLGPANTYTSVDLSPDGRRVLAHVGGGRADVSGLWILDAETGESSRSVVRTGDGPVWSPDGERFAVVSETEIVIADVLRGTTRTVLTMETPTGIADWTADGRGLIVMQQHPETGTPNVMLLEIENGGEFRPIVETSDWDFPGRLSPDGRYLTFASDRRNPGSRSCELFVAELGGSGGVWQISTGGAPTGIGRSLCDWSRDGKRLYYLNRSGVLMRADIDTTNGFRAGTPVPVSPDLGKVTQVNVAPDGRLLVLRPSEDQAVPPVRLLTDWTALLDD